MPLPQEAEAEETRGRRRKRSKYGSVEEDCSDAEGQAAFVFRRSPLRSRRRSRGFMEKRAISRLNVGARRCTLLRSLSPLVSFS